jgi:hypothetical protein
MAIPVRHRAQKWKWEIKTTISPECLYAPEFVFNDISGVIGTYDRFDRVYFTTDIGSGLLLTGDDRLSVHLQEQKLETSIQKMEDHGPPSQLSQYSMSKLMEMQGTTSAVISYTFT